MHEISSRCDVCPIHNRGPCVALDDQSLLALAKFARRKTLKTHEIIFHEGDISNQYFTVLSGVVKLVKALADGRQHIIGLMFPPGFICQTVNSHHTYSAEASTEVELCYYPREAFDIFRKAHTELEHNMFEQTVRELDTCRDWILLLGRKASYERVAGFLLMMAERFSESGQNGPDNNSPHFQLPFTRSEMADYLGLTLETVSRQFSRLRQKGIIALPSSRDIVIADVEQLAAVANIETCSNSFGSNRSHLSARSATVQGWRFALAAEKTVTVAQ